VSAARDLLAAWRAQRARATVPEHADTDAAALAAQDRRPDSGTLVGSDDDPERQAMREYYAAEPSAEPYLPTHDDALRDGLLRGFHLARRCRERRT
jgi:hypothetical protein